MRSLLLLSAILFFTSLLQAADEYPFTEDSKPHEGVAKGEMIKGNFTANDRSVFPGTEREYQIYVPVGFDKSKPAPFMVFQDGRVIFIITVPQGGIPYDVCFGGKDLSELFIACGDKIYKRQTKAHGVVSGQQPPIKPAAPKL